MKAIITVTGVDCVGITALVSSECARMGANILDISQSVMREYFAMVMLVDIQELNTPFAEFSESLRRAGEERALDIRVMHEDIFNSMHRI